MACRRAGQASRWMYRAQARLGGAASTRDSADAAMLAMGTGARQPAVGRAARGGALGGGAATSGQEAPAPAAIKQIRVLRAGGPGAPKPTIGACRALGCTTGC